MKSVLVVSVIYGIICGAISLGLSVIGGHAAQWIFIPFVLLGGVGIGFAMLHREGKL